jgi:hypothetical protein
VVEGALREGRGGDGMDWKIISVSCHSTAPDGTPSLADPLSLWTMCVCVTLHTLIIKYSLRSCTVLHGTVLCSAEDILKSAVLCWGHVLLRSAVLRTFFAELWCAVKF